MTRQQQLIIDVVTELCDHPDAAEVYINAKKRMPQIGSSTVYRNLAMLSQQGLLRRIPIAGEADRFDAVLFEHEHVICRYCGKVRDIDITAETDTIKNKAGGNELSVEMILRETCSACVKTATDSGVVNDHD